MTVAVREEAVRAGGFWSGVALGLGIIPASWWCDSVLGGVAGWIMFPVFTGLALTVGGGGFGGFSGRRAAGVAVGMVVPVAAYALLMLPLLVQMMMGAS